MPGPPWFRRTVEPPREMKETQGKAVFLGKHVAPVLDTFQGRCSEGNWTRKQVLGLQGRIKTSGAHERGSPESTPCKDRQSTGAQGGYCLSFTLVREGYKRN